MTKQQLIKYLTNFGFTTSQAKLYVAGLTLKKTLMAELARTANIHRTTAYYLMEELQRRGFFRTQPVRRRTYYIAISPQQFLLMVKKRDQIAQKILPVLKSIYNRQVIFKKRIK